MNTEAQWVQGYARQALADFNTWKSIQPLQSVAECHKLLFLQMACEKLCKAHLIRNKVFLPTDLQTGHAFIAKHLTAIIGEQLTLFGMKPNGVRGLLKHVRNLANEIEVLNPAVDRADKRPDNCEYPWEDELHIVHSPLDWRFTPSQLLAQPRGVLFIKLLGEAVGTIAK